MKLIPLGPRIYQSYISDDFYNFLMQEYKQLEKYERLYQNQNQFKGSDFRFVNDENRKYIEDNILVHVKEYINTDSLELMDQWINIQSHDGFLTNHKHTGNISYAIYLKIPGYLQNYNSVVQSDHSYTEGQIQFNYGYDTSLSSMHTNISPQEKMILLFPSEVYHYVYPFRDRESERVSISGNLRWKS